MKILALQIDPIETLHPFKDTSYLLGLEAQRRGYKIFYYTANNLIYEDNKLYAKGYWLVLSENKHDYYNLLSSEIFNLEMASCLFIRQDPPFDMAYFTNCMLLEKLAEKIYIFNAPYAIKNLPEKISPLFFPHLIPSTVITQDVDVLENFKNKHIDIILKPLYKAAGKNIYCSKGHDGNFKSVVDMLLQDTNLPIIAQKFLPEIQKGDKRIFLLEGNVIGGINRLPTSKDYRANLHCGGKLLPLSLCRRDYEICDTISPLLKKYAIDFAGIDIIGSYLIEINITSPTCLREYNILYQTKIEEKVMDMIDQKVKEKSKW